MKSTFRAWAIATLVAAPWLSASALPGGNESGAAVAPAAPPVDALKEAIRAASWLEAVSIQTPLGRVWPTDPAGPKVASSGIYSGGAGVVWFLTALAKETGDVRWLALAKGGGEFLIASSAKFPTGDQCGLYTGEAGVAVVLLELARVSGDDSYRQAASEIVDRVLAAADGDAGWMSESSSTDIISGVSGIGLALFDLAEGLGRKDARSSAINAARTLLDRGEPSKHGLWWPMTAGYPRVMPNFSHGTAGVAFFLARAHAESGDPSLLEGALAGARHLLAIADRADRADPGCRIAHHTPGGEELFYYGWCHGPAGTGRLFLELARVTEDSDWSDAARSGAASIVASGAPEVRSDGLWQNVGICCGDAGIAAYFLELYGWESRKEDLEYASRTAEAILARSTASGEQLRWIQAEHRTRPELLVAQSGYMQGAAGVGWFLLQLRASREGRTLKGLPDRVLR